MKNKVFLRSPAKLNLFLEVLGRRVDGYHELFTLFQSIKFHDEIEIELKEGKAEVLFFNQSVPEENTVSKVLKKLNIKDGVRIKIIKNIPQGAGLGGGSSNSVVTLMGLNSVLELGLSFNEMEEIASGVGSDTVFFLYGGTAIGEGRGERIKPVSDFSKNYVIIVLQNYGLSTRKIYSFLTEYGDKSKIYAYFLKGEYSRFYNRLEAPAFKLYPELKRVKEMLLEEGLEIVSMSGSGSSIFGIDDDLEKLKRATRKFNFALIIELLKGEDYYSYIGVSPSGKASDFGSDIRRFESSHPREKNR